MPYKDPRKKRQKDREWRQNHRQELADYMADYRARRALEDTGRQARAHQRQTVKQERILQRHAARPSQRPPAKTQRVTVEEDTNATQQLLQEAYRRAESLRQRQSQAAPSRAVSTPPKPLLIEAPKSQGAYQRLPDGYAEAFEKAFGLSYRPELSWDENVAQALKCKAEEAARKEQRQKREDPLSLLFRKQREKLHVQQVQPPAPQSIFDPYQPNTEQLLQSASYGAPAPKHYN